MTSTHHEFTMQPTKKGTHCDKGQETRSGQGLSRCQRRHSQSRQAGGLPDNWTGELSEWGTEEAIQSRREICQVQGCSRDSLNTLSKVDLRTKQNSIYEMLRKM